MKAKSLPSPSSSSHPFLSNHSSAPQSSRKTIIKSKRLKQPPHFGLQNKSFKTVLNEKNMNCSFFFPAAHLSCSFCSTHFPKSVSPPAVPCSWGDSINLPRSARLRSASAVGDGFAIASPDASFYELLGISESGSLSEIKQAYKQMARKYHPDVSPPDLAAEYTRRFIRVQEAYETLSDPRRRAMYDRDLARGLHLAFSARKRFEEVHEVRSEWKNRWQDQVAELKRRSTNKKVVEDNLDHLSWGARMRQQRKQSSME